MKKRAGWSYHESLKQHGTLQVYTKGGMRHQNLAIRYSGRGQNKDVYSVTLRKPDGSVVQAVMKVMASKWYDRLESDVKRALDSRTDGMMPKQYGLYKDVRVSGQDRLEYDGCIAHQACKHPTKRVKWKDVRKDEERCRWCGYDCRVFGIWTSCDSGEERCGV